MSDTIDKVEVKEGYYEKLGAVHCGVVKGFKINCGPQQLSVLEDGNSYTFDKTAICAERSGDNVTFSQL